jgi:diadenosine tetraphosphatase ApaH/serine/threonine PP2A family protein phosphatase
MQIALLSDVHANREALAACIAHARSGGVDRYVFLGDLVGYGADPAWVVDCVRTLVARGGAAVLGNHDAAVLNAPTRTMRQSARRVIEWTCRHLQREQLEFLAALPFAVTEDDRLYVHANAWAPGDWQYILSATEARESLLATASRYTFCGHVHEPALYHINAQGDVSGFVPVPGTPIPLGKQRRWLAIPGTVGQPRDGVLAARYAAFDTDAALLTFFEIAYDYETARHKTIAAGLPPNIVVKHTPSRT